jgi:hypothetical protein
MADMRDHQDGRMPATAMEFLASPRTLRIGTLRG